MALTILLLLLFTAVLLMYGWRNRYIIFFALLVLASALSMFTLTVEVARVSNYLVPANYLIRPLETRLYAFLQRIVHLPLSTLMVLRNTGIVLYFGGIVCFVHSFSGSVRLDNTRPSLRRIFLTFIPLIGLPAVFFLFYHPQTAFVFYKLVHGPHAGYGIILLRTLDKVLTAGILIYLLSPVLFLVINYKRGKMTFLSGILLRLACALFLLNISFFLLFFTGVFSPSCEDVINYGFWCFTLPTQLPVFYTSVLPFMSFAVIIAVFIMLMHLHADHLLSFLKFRGIRKNLNALYANVRNVMHSEKNLLFTIRILAQDALDAGSREDREEKLQKILDLCNHNMEDLSRTLNDAHEMNMNAMQNDFISAVKEAVSSLHVPENVRIEQNLPDGPLPLQFDIYHMTHAISNVLNNSLDALAAANPPDPLIRLDLSTSRDWVYFSVWDNGCGIPPKLIRKVEQPYVSTKKNKKNSWGIGLSYVFSVVRAHYGQVHIRSRQNSFTQVEILLPRSRKRRKP